MTTWTSANQLTVLRMIFVPIFVLMIVYNHFGLGLIIFLVAGVTDALDGLIARRFHQQTTLGALLDPVADKLLLTSSFITLSLYSLPLTTRIPLWLTITAISRDVLILISAIIINLATGQKHFPPSIYGKMTTVLELITVLAALVGNYGKIRLPYFSVFVYVTLFFIVFSGLHYFYRSTHLMSRDNKDFEKKSAPGIRPVDIRSKRP